MYVCGTIIISLHNMYSNSSAELLRDSNFIYEWYDLFHKQLHLEQDITWQRMIIIKDMMETVETDDAFFCNWYMWLKQMDNKRKIIH